MSSDITLVGIKQFQAALKNLGREAHQEVQKAVDASGLSVLSTIKNSMIRGNPTGNIYERYKPRRTHVASAPGEPPAVDTGRNVSAVTFKNAAPLTVEVFSNLDGAFALEFGRRDGSIKPRPAWVPAVEIEEPKFLRRIESALSSVIS